MATRRGTPVTWRRTGKREITVDMDAAVEKVMDGVQPDNGTWKAQVIEADAELSSVTGKLEIVTEKLDTVTEKLGELRAERKALRTAYFAAVEALTDAIHGRGQARLAFGEAAAETGIGDPAECEAIEAEQIIMGGDAT